MWYELLSCFAQDPWLPGTSRWWPGVGPVSAENVVRAGGKGLVRRLVVARLGGYRRVVDLGWQ